MSSVAGGKDSKSQNLNLLFDKELEKIKNTKVLAKTADNIKGSILASGRTKGEGMAVQGVRSVSAGRSGPSVNKLAGNVQQGDRGKKISQSRMMEARVDFVRRKQVPIDQNQTKTSTRNVPTLGSNIAQQIWVKGPKASDGNKARAPQAANPVHPNAPKTQNPSSAADQRNGSARAGLAEGKAKARAGRGAGQINVVA